MSTRIKLVQGDTKPAIICALTDEKTGAAIGLNSTTVRMYFRAAETTDILATLVGTLLPGFVQTDGTIITTSPYNTLGAGGRVQFNWGTTDLNQEPGNYEGEIEITFNDGTKQTVYDVLKFKLREDF